MHIALKWAPGRSLTCRLLLLRLPTLNNDPCDLEVSDTDGSTASKVAFMHESPLFAALLLKQPGVGLPWDSNAQRVTYIAMSSCQCHQRRSCAGWVLLLGLPQ